MGGILLMSSPKIPYFFGEILVVMATERKFFSSKTVWPIFNFVCINVPWMTLSQVRVSFESKNSIWLFIDKVHFLFYGPGHHWGDIWFLIIHIFCCINLWQNALYSISNAYKRETEIFFRKKRSFVFLLKIFYRCTRCNRFSCYMSS